MNVDQKQIEAQLAALPGAGTRFDAAEEAQHIASLAKQPAVAERLATYGDPTVCGIGGSGLILRATHLQTGVERALKIPRDRLYRESKAPADGAETLVQEDPELRALAKLSHQNITRLYEAFTLPGTSAQCMITEYVDQSIGLDTYASQSCTTHECRSNTQAMEHALRNVSRVVYEIVDALSYMHDRARLLHFDIKPENLLVTPAGQPYVTDMGFARDRDHHGSPEENIRVGFTWAYAHPRLTSSERAKITQQKAKSSDILAAKELSPRFDIFAFGRTLQNVLYAIKAGVGDSVHSHYHFSYLHLVACLCLDGENSTVEDNGTGRYIADRYMEMPGKFFKQNKFASFEEIKVCLERLLGRRRVEDEVPELDRWYGSTIKVSDVGTTALTPRVADLINHPALLRLKREKQLGMLDTVFPTGTHNRYQHTLGTYHAVTQYLGALYNDPDSPVFRALFQKRKAEALLVASLIHDLGHTAYGHELEEIDSSVFRHEAYVEPISESVAFLDSKERTLRTVIEDDSTGGWALDWADVRSMLSKRVAAGAAIDGVLHDALDGHIDADKFDYLIRDSVECRVNYGHGIDYDRFLRSLTTLTDDDGTLRLAIKQKGAASAEAFALARYQLYQSLYWHHTFRATKAMLLEAVRLILEELKASSGGELFVEAMGEAYLREAIGVREVKRQAQLSKPRARAAGQKSMAKIIEERLEAEAGNTLPIPYDNDSTMRFLASISTDKARRLLEGLQHRNYYKRIIEFSPSQLSESNFESLRADYSRVDKRGQMQRDLQGELLKSLHTSLQGSAPGVESQRKDRALEFIADRESEQPLFLLDIPLRGWFGAGEYPRYVSDYKRRHFRVGAGHRGFEGNRDFWDGTLATMMKNIAFIRVYCDPEIHPIVTSVLSSESIMRATVDAIPQLKGK